MAETTIYVPASATIYVATDPLISPTPPILTTASQALARTGTNTAAVAVPLPSSFVSQDFTLYLLATVPSGISTGSLDVSSLIQALNTGPNPQASTDFPPFYWNGGGPGPAETQIVPIAAGQVMTVPIVSVLNTDVHINSLTERLSEALRAQYHAVTPSIVNDASQRPTTPVPATAASSPANDTSTTIAGASGAGITGGGNASNLGGAVAGGTIGGIVFGALIALAIAWCCLRKRRAPGDSSSADEPVVGLTVASAGEKISQPSGDRMATGDWRNHLPQDKDDRTVRNAVQSLFQHIEMHVEGFYGDLESRVPTEQALVGLANVSSDGFLEEIPKDAHFAHVLEGVVARCVVHRISLRTAAADSFLPPEYIILPQFRGWHMELGLDGNHAAMQGKKGFPQAMSEWRLLTGFLRREPLKDAAFAEELRTRITKLASRLEKAFSPWKLPSKSSEARSKSLTGILEEASRTGIMLFQQRTLYAFDWSPSPRKDGRAIVISPALIKLADEYGEVLHDRQVLVPAT